MIIGICGPMGSGKTTVATFIKKYIPTAQFVPLAGPLKEVCRSLGWDEAKDKKGRKLLQTIGHAVRTYIYQDAWLDKWRATVHKLSNTSIIIVDDVRYFNEAYAVLANRGIIIKILGRNEPKLPRFFRHSSEKYYKDLPHTHVIYNTGTLDELDQKVFNILELEKLCQLT